MKIENIDILVEEIIEGETGGDPKRKAGRIALIAIAVLAVLALVVGLYLLGGWLIALLVGFITSGAVGLSALQGAAILFGVNLLFGGIVSSSRR